MTKSFSIGAAGIAIAMSLVGTAQAQNVAEAQGAPTAVDNVVTSAFASQSVPETAMDLSMYPTDLLAADLDAQLTQVAAPVVPMALDSTGVVTPKSIDPFYGNINPFYGNINPLYGDINAFWGNINPFYGDINAFWGNINPFYGNISPFYGDINAFWGDIDAFYGDISAFDAAHLSALGDFWQTSGAQVETVEGLFNKIQRDANGVIIRDGTPNNVVAALGVLIDQGEAQFGAAYTAKTGKSFDAFVSEVFGRHGIDPTNKYTLENKTASERAALYLDWHDSLNQYSGVDAVDHWMAAINWTPSVTHIQGEGKDTIIGIVDGSFSADADLGNNIIWSGGHANELHGHGAGVASLIAGAHDGEGVMGIAPEVKIATYNPFDSDGTSSWDAVGDAIVALKGVNQYANGGLANASIINLSLGESGWVFSDGLAQTLARSDVDQFHKDTVFVIAAGNDGVTQTVDVEFANANDVAAIFVGSINPLGEISSFSNRPGDACLTANGACASGNMLKDRFIVAPGELILVSDGQGGVVRRSGTSFAAPLVSGAISLLHDRWEWLAKHPEETADIILRSARDLGAPGVDEVYGHGLLDVVASQSPLNFNELTYRSYQRVGGFWKPSRVSVTELLGAGIPEWWETEDVFFTMFEQIGNTERDFIVPVSEFTFGKSTNALGRGFERLQDFVNQRFARWINSNGSDSNGDGLPGFTEVRSNGGKLNGEWSLRYDAIMPGVSQEGTWRPTHGAATLTNPKGNMSFTMGHGQGAMALTGYRFGVMSDHDPFTGGVNPVLGFASGEVFAAASYEVMPGTSLRVGYSENREQWNEVGGVTAEQLLTRRELGARPATAMTIDFEQKVSDAVSVNAQYTQLREDNALLGTQTSAIALLGAGSSTEAMTVSATVEVGGGLTFDLSATGARTETADGQLLTNAGSIWSSAGQFTATKRGLFSGNDMLRISVAQPLQVEQGQLQLRSDQIIDRATGETAAVTQTFGIGTRRRVTGEAVYAMPLTTSSEFGVFGRYVSAGDAGDEQNYVVGGNFSLRF
ncbi:MAG: S8 family serine peptidase [Pseudomonadota bacterium]